MKSRKSLLFLLGGILLISSLATADPLVIGHRGFSSVAPENTLVSMQKAIDLSPQPNFVELDLYRSKDGVLVVSHDENTLRTTGVDAIIRETPFQKLRTFDAGYAKVFGDKFKGTKIPRFEEVLDLVKNTPVGVMIECKQLFLAKQVIDILRKRGELHKHIIASFDELTIYNAKQLEPSVKTLYLTNTINPSIIWRAKDLKANIIGTNLKAKPESVKVAHDDGFDVWVWTVDEPADVIAWTKAGVDGIITNMDDMVLKVSREK